MDIRLATPDDARSLAQLHIKNLPPSLSDFTQLGPRIVERFYRRAIERNVGSAICAIDGDRIGAFVFVTTDIGNLFNAALLRSNGEVLSFLLAANPLGVMRAFRTKVMSRTLKIESAPEAVYLVVDPAYRGKKLGSILMERAEQWFRDQRVTFYQLNAHADNDAVLKIHFANGHRIVREFRKDGVLNYTLQKAL